MVDPVLVLMWLSLRLLLEITLGVVVGVVSLELLLPSLLLLGLLLLPSLLLGVLWLLIGILSLLMGVLPLLDGMLSMLLGLSLLGLA